MNTIDNIEGEVKSWFTDKGFGFVRTKGYGDVFISQRILKRNQYIEIGTLVSMSIIPSTIKKGEYQAIRLNIVEDSNNLFGVIDWFNGIFGVVLCDSNDYFIPKNSTNESLKQKDYVLFSPALINEKSIATRIVRIDSNIDVNLFFNRILTAYNNTPWKIKIKILQTLSLENRQKVVENHVKINKITENEALNYLKISEFSHIEFPPFDIEFLVSNLDIVQDESFIISFPNKVYDVFLENYLPFIHRTSDFGDYYNSRFIKVLSLIKNEDIFFKSQNIIFEFFKKIPFDSNKKSYSTNHINKMKILEIVPAIIREQLIYDFIQGDFDDIEVIQILKIWGWRNDYISLFYRLETYFEKINTWDRAYSSDTRFTKKDLLNLLPIELQKRLLKNFIHTDSSIDEENYKMIVDWYCHNKIEDEEIKAYIDRIQSFISWYSSNEFDDLEILDIQLKSFKDDINKCSQRFSDRYFNFTNIQRHFVDTYSRFRMLELSLLKKGYSEKQEIKLHVLEFFCQPFLVKIYESKKENLKTNKFSYISSQFSKVATKLNSFEFSETLNSYCRLLNEKDSYVGDMEAIDIVRLWIFNLSDEYDFNQYCYYFFMLNKLEQWIFSKKASALMGEEVKQSMLRQRIPWQFIRKEDDYIRIYEATWKSIWFENKKVKILMNDENVFSAPYDWHFSEYKFNFLYDYIVGRKLETLIIQFDISTGKINSIENLDALSEVLFKAEIQRLTEKGDKETLDKLLSGELMKIPIPINSVLRNECLTYLNNLQLVGLEPTRLIERTISFNQRNVSLEQSFLYTIPLNNEEFAIIWESLEIDKAKATHIFRCKVNDYKDIFSDIQSFLSSYTAVRSILNSKNELLERKENLGYYRRIDHDNFIFEKWKDKLHLVLPNLVVASPN